MLTLSQLLHLKLVVAEHVATQLAMALALRKGDREDVLEAEQGARNAAEAYLRYTDSLLQKEP